MIPHQASLLYVEDDASSAEILILYLKQRSFHVTHFDNAEDGMRAIENIHFDIAILDIMLPGGDGRELLKKAVLRKIPSIMVTARVSESDRINGFELGADDYICKPYSPREVVARVAALLNRSRRGHQLSVLKFEDLSINLESGLVTCDGANISLTKAEFSLLTALASRPGRIFDRQMLLDAIQENQSAVTERTVDTHFANLRKKLKDNKKAPRFVATKYGEGYKFVAKRVNS